MSDYPDDDYDDAEVYPAAPGYVAGSETSAAAADSIDATTMRLRVLDHFVAMGVLGATDDELEAALGMRHQTASARRRELELMGRLVGTGTKRPTRSGRMAQIYVHIDAAPPELRAKTAAAAGPLALDLADHATLRWLSAVLADAAKAPTLAPIHDDVQRLQASVAALLKRAQPRGDQRQFVMWPPAA